MAATYRHNYVNFGKGVLCAPWMVADMRQRMVRVKQAAITLSPVGNPKRDRHSGQYIESFIVNSGTQFAFGGRRAVAKVTNDAPHAAAVEFGFGKTPKYRVLGRALAAAG